MIAAAAGLLALGTAASVLFVDPHSVVPDPDGSAQKPFRAVAAALQAARDGDTLQLATGLFTERVVLTKSVGLRGSKATVLASPDATGVVVDVRRPALLEHLAIQGGDIGVRAGDGTRLRAVDFSAQRRAAVMASGSVDVEGGRFLGLFERPELVGLDVSGGALTVTGARFDGPFRWAVRGKASEMTLRSVEVEGAVGGIAFEDGSRGSVRGGVLAQGRRTGVLARGSSVEIKDVLISRWEHGIDALEGSEVRVEDSAVGYCSEAGITAQGSKLAVRHLVHVGPARLAALAGIQAQVRIEEVVLFEPGATGIALHGGRGEVSGGVVRAAQSASEGDGIYLEDADAEVQGAFIEAVSGNGLTVVGGVVKARALQIDRAAGSGIRVEKSGKLDAEGIEVRRSGVGLSVSGGGSVTARFNRYFDVAMERK